MRSLTVLAACGVLAVGLLGWSSVRSADSTPQKDPWVGTYFKFSRYDSDRRGQFGEAAQFTITKDGDSYKLSKPYDTWKFTEVEKGVLSDGKGGIGKLYLGKAEFSKGDPVRIIRADFCYEDFFLFSTDPLVFDKPAPKETEKRAK